MTATLRHIAILILATAVVCGPVFVLVESTATEVNTRQAPPVAPGGARREIERRDRPPDLADIPLEVGGELVIVVVAAWAGRKILRLRL